MNESSQLTMQDRLDRAERALERCERLATASQYASVIMHEVNNYLQGITNLVYLTKLNVNVPDQVKGDMEAIESQLRMLASVTRRSLAYHRDHSEMKAVDLVEVVQSALKLHEDKINKHNVKVEIQFADSAVAPVREGEIFQ